MALKDTVTNVVDRLRGLLRREPKAMDAFGGDDLFDGDGESGSGNLGSKIALIISGVMVLALVSLIGAIIMTGDEAAVPVGSLADIEVVEEADPTASNDRSIERRPWLTPTDAGATGPRLGMGDAPKPDDKPAAATPAPSTPTPAPTQVAKAPEPTKSEPTKTEPAKAAPPKPAATQTAAAPTQATPPPTAATPAAATQTTATPAPSTPSATPPTQVAAAPPSAALSAMPEPEPEPAEEQQQATLPSLLSPAGPAPGAPARFDNTDAGGAVSAGARPRLNEPRLPPTDPASVNAPPPRFNALAEIKAPPAADPSAKPAKVAIVVEGLGLNRTATEAALAKLPPVVTLSFSPYARDLKRLMERAKAKGHEVLIEVPLESKAFPAEDPGPLGLLTGLEAKDNEERLSTILKEATGATGVFDAMGSKFRESPTHINGLLEKLKQQSLFYVQGRPGVRVGEAELPSATADVVVDERPFRAAVDARFDYAEKLAKYQGSAVAVMSARPISFERLALWVDQLPRKGITLAPVSQVLVQ